MKWFSAIETSKFDIAMRSLVDQAKKNFGSEQADLGFIFFSPAHRKNIVSSWIQWRNEIPVKTLIGCSAGGIIGGGHEVEDEPAISLTLGTLPQVNIKPFFIKQESLPALDGSPKPWRDLVHTDKDENAQFILISDPFSLDADSLVAGLDFAFPSSTKVGGLASGGAMPDENILILNEQLHRQGVVGVSLSGNISIDPIVAQGCRPIGEAMMISELRDNVVVTLNNKTPVEILTKLYESLSKRDQQLMQTSLFLGVLMDSFMDKPKRGDFLIRNIIGVDMDKGVLAVGAHLRPGQIVQFHLRDSETSREDLEMMLKKAKDKQQEAASMDALGAVLFSCMGRGEKLYGEKNHDTKIFKTVLGDIPIGGFFCNGEIGPVGGKTYLHGYTSSFAVFRPSKTKSKSKSSTDKPSKEKI